MLKDKKRVVVKIGSSLLVNSDSGKLNHAWLSGLILDLVSLYQSGHEVVVVSSGAIALGRHTLNFPLKQLTLEKAQASAACGQVALAHAYQKELQKHHIAAAQVLLTIRDSENRRRYLNARNTLQTLLRSGAIPIINENDTVATAEIRYGDNDRLSARVALMVDADLLILLSDIDGLYSAPPSQDNNAQFIDKVTEIDARILSMAKDSLSSYGSGGMKTKIVAAQMVTTSGCDMLIANGHHDRPIQQLQASKRYTHFVANDSVQNAKKSWLQHHLKMSGRVVVDEGAKQALMRNKSLLAVGVTHVEGPFHKGDCVSVVDSAGLEVARGLINYSSIEAEKIKGKRQDEAVNILKFQCIDTLIHRDNLVISIVE